MGIKLLLKEGSKRTIAKNFRTGTLLAQGGAPRGQSAYEQAVEGGYEGTKAGFEEALATGITTISENITDVNTVADNITDINTVAENIADVHTVAENITDVNTVADNVTDVNTVAGISSDVTQVSGISNAVQTVSSHDSEVTLVSDNMASVMTTASNIGDVNTIASNISDVNTIAPNISDISNVNDNLTIIQEVSENVDDVIAAADAVEEVLPHITEINNVSDNISDVVTVAGINADVSAVASNSSNINTVSGNNANITTVATNISNINAVAADLTNIDNASTYAANAANSATNAATSETNAQTWAEGTDVQVAALGGTKSSKGWAARAEEIVTSIGTVMRYKGSVANYAALQAIQNPTLGDTYNVLDTGSNYTWDGSAWDAIGSVVDLSAYRTAAQQDVIDATKQDTLVSGTNIKTVNGNSLLGSGNVDIKALPSQTGQSGKFLTTDGTDASWSDKPLVNSATQSNSLAIGGSIGTSTGQTVVVGQNAQVNYGSFCTAVGASATASIVGGSNGLAVGYNASVTKSYATQLGNGTNSDANTFKVANQNGNFELMSADGTIPVARLNTMTGADGTNAGAKGAVPAPAATDNNKFLKGDGTWDNPAGGGRNVGEIVESTVPLTDAGLHLLDGSLLSGSGSYSEFVTYMASMYVSNPELFTTEADWQTSVTNYGVCGKFVYDSVNNTVRLPKKSSTERHLVKSTVSGSDWCDVYSDGWCEQGGWIQYQATGSLTFPKAYSVIYGVAFNGISNKSSAAYVRELYPNTVTTTGFSYTNVFPGGNANYDGVWWKSYGYIDVSIYQAEQLYQYIVIANSTKTEIEVDIDEIATDLNGKADVDFSNITANAKKVVFGRAFTPANITIAKGNASIAGTYTLTDLPDDGVVRLVLLNCRLVLGANNRSSMAIQTDVMSNYIIVAETNNSFTASGAVLVPMIRQVTLSFPQITGGVMADTEFMFRGYI